MVLITGSTGFVGRHVVRELCSRGMKVRCLVRSSSNLVALSGTDVELCSGDIADQASLEAALGDIEVVVRLVAIITETKHATFEKVNFLGTQNLVPAALQMKPRP